MKPAFELGLSLSMLLHGQAQLLTRTPVYDGVSQQMICRGEASVYRDLKRLYEFSRENGTCLELARNMLGVYGMKRLSTF